MKKAYCIMDEDKILVVSETKEKCNEAFHHIQYHRYDVIPFSGDKKIKQWYVKLPMDDKLMDRHLLPWALYTQLAQPSDDVPIADKITPKAHREFFVEWKKTLKKCVKVDPKDINFTNYYENDRNHILRNFKVKEAKQNKPGGYEESQEYHRERQKEENPGKKIKKQDRERASQGASERITEDIPAIKRRRQREEEEEVESKPINAGLANMSLHPPNKPTPSGWDQIYEKSQNPPPEWQDRRIPHEGNQPISPEWQEMIDRIQQSMH